MEAGKRDLLTDHLDESLQGRSLPAVEQMIRREPDAREEWEYQNLAVEAIRHEGLVQQVAAIGKEYAAVQGKARIVPLKRYAQAAAIVFLLLGGAAVYKFYSVSGKSIYNKQYMAYELRVSRGEAGADQGALIEAWQQKNWKAVISLYDKATVRDNRLLFLSGMASLELAQYADAIGKFESLLAGNERTGDHYFQDEAEYYLALAYLANNNNAKGIGMIEKIRATPGHLYSGTIRKWPGLDLKILEYKTGKDR